MTEISGMEATRAPKKELRFEISDMVTIKTALITTFKK